MEMPWEPGRAWARWTVERDLLTPATGVLFGGYLGALADHLLALAAMTTLADDESFATTHFGVHLLRPVVEGVLSVDARVVTRSRRVAYCEASMEDRSRTLVARAHAMQLIRRGS